MSSGVLMLSANTPWVLALADALAAERPATAMRFYDLLTWRRTRPRWPADGRATLRRVMRVLPPGYAGRFERPFRPVLRRLIDVERRRLRQLSGVEPYVIAPYPYLEPWLESVPDERLIYYSLDEYAFYEPHRARRIHALEDRLVARARRTLCLSHYQADVLRRRHPARANDILHFPLGVEEGFLNPSPETAPEPGLIGYVGNLTDRVDWPLVAEVARRAPDLRFAFTGSLTWLADGVGAERSGPDWKAARDAAFALPNVEHRGAVAQAEVADCYWRAAVNWMPYDVRHGFNLASCPTKIMDALAAGRPFASTDVPECRLYPGLVHIAGDAAAMARLLTELVARPRPDAGTLLDFARRQSWRARAGTLLDLIDD